MTGESNNPPAPQDQNISDVGAMEVRGLTERSRGERISDFISGLASTPAFALAHVLIEGIREGDGSGGET
jgi:hypothetical protein